MRKGAYLLMVIVFCAACRPFQDVQVTGIKGINVSRISMEGMEAGLMVGIKNPNNFGFWIRRSEFEVKYSGVYIGKARLNKKVRIKANEEDTYLFNLSSDFKNTNVLDVMKLLNGATFKNTIEVNGTLRAGKLFVTKKIPVSVKEQVKLN